MGFFRFRRRIKLLPGVRLNLSKTGVSTSIGRHCATINIRGDRAKTTVGIPGTGLSYSEQQRIGAAVPTGTSRPRVCVGSYCGASRGACGHLVRLGAPGWVAKNPGQWREDLGLERSR